MSDLLCSIDNSVIGGHSVVAVEMKNQLYGSHLQTERGREGSSLRESVREGREGRRGEKV